MFVMMTASSLALYWSVRLALANWFSKNADLSGALHAMTLAPGNEEYMRRAAELSDEAGGNGTAYYKKAVKVDPYASGDWVQLGLHAERDGQYRQAEQCLQQALRVDRLFEPAWALANFYFRREDPTNTLHWAHKSLSVGEGDVTAVFRLCWQTAPDSRRILRDAIPNRASILAQYLEFLLATDRFNEAFPVATNLASIAGKNQVNPLLEYCNHALAVGALECAATVWNVLARRHFIPGRPITANPVHVVANPTFDIAPTGYGFDWKLSVPGGVLADSGGPDGLRIEFSGKQPDSSVLLSQYVRLVPKARYRLAVRYQSEDIAQGTGLRWRVLNPNTGRDVENSEVNLPSGNGMEPYAHFTDPPDLRWGLLQLLYERTPGTNRIEGSLRLISIDIAAER